MQGIQKRLLQAVLGRNAHTFTHAPKSSRSQHEREEREGREGREGTGQDFVRVNGGTSKDNIMRRSTKGAQGGKGGKGGKELRQSITAGLPINSPLYKHVYAACLQKKKSNGRATNSFWPCGGGCGTRRRSLHFSVSLCLYTHLIFPVYSSYIIPCILILYSLYTHLIFPVMIVRSPCLDAHPILYAYPMIVPHSCKYATPLGG